MNTDPSELSKIENFWRIFSSLSFYVCMPYCSSCTKLCVRDFEIWRKKPKVIQQPLWPALLIVIHWRCQRCWILKEFGKSRVCVWECLHGHSREDESLIFDLAVVHRNCVLIPIVVTEVMKRAESDDSKACRCSDTFNFSLVKHSVNLFYAVFVLWNCFTVLQFLPSLDKVIEKL